MAEVDWRSPGETWRVYARTHCTGDSDCPEPVHVEGCYAEAYAKPAREGDR